MKFFAAVRRIIFTLLALASFSSPAQTAAPIMDETPAQHDARMQWWREARFGLFIHWGIYSVPAGTWQEKPVAGIGEWIMNKGKIPVADYAGASQFLAGSEGAA